MGTIGKIDKMLEFGGIDFGTTAGTYYSENVLNLAETDAGGMAVHVSVTEKAVGGTNAVFAVEAGVNDSSYEKIAQSGEILTADLDVDDEVVIPIPRGYTGTHLRVSVTTTGTFSAGAAECRLDPYVGK